MTVIGVLDLGADRKGGRFPGLLTPEEIDELVKTIHQRSHNESHQATGAAANNLDLYQVNCTFYDALGQSDGEYLIARTLQLFTPGIPQSTTWDCWPALTTWVFCAAPA